MIIKTAQIILKDNKPFDIKTIKHKEDKYPLLSLAAYYKEMSRLVQEAEKC
jgi:hypothetical protein